MPSLAIGDYVEYEYMMDRGPSLGGTFQSPGWYFQSHDQPFDLSRMVVVAPRDIALVVDSGGPTPDAVETSDGDLRVLTWTVEGSRPLVAEPRSADVPEVLPRLVFAVGATWDDRFEALRDRLSSGNAVDPAAVRLVRRILRRRPNASTETKIAILHHWVLENIEPGGGDEITARMLAAKTGDRTRILRYMLQLAGLHADLALSGVYGAREPGRVPELELYGSAVIRVDRGSESPLFVWAETRGAPALYLPPPLRGQTAVVLREGLPRETITAPPASADTREIVVDIDVASDGSARVDVRETHRGITAVSWRGGLEGVPEADLERGFEAAYAARVVPGAALESLEIEGRDDPEAPLVLRYRTTVRALGRTAGDELLLPPLFTNELAAGYASLPARTTTELVNGQVSTVRLRIHDPSGRARPPADASIEGPAGARFVQTTRRTEDGLEVERRLVLEPALVTAATYDAFARFCRQTVEIEGREIAVER